jgi:hypothetical protein
MTTQPIGRTTAPGLPRPGPWVRRLLAARRNTKRQREPLGLAARLERAVAEAHEPPARFATAIPVQRHEVRATEPLLLELAARLRDGGPIAPSGIVKTKRLLTDGTGPLFAPSAPGALWDAVEAAILALDDARAQTT